MPSRYRVNRGSARCGFSLVELLCVIAILAIMVGLILPGIERTAYQSRATRAALAVQQAAALVTVYTHDWKEIYPVGAEHAFDAMHRWPQALVAHGLLDNVEAADPDGYRQTGGNSIALTVCVLLDSERMRQGTTVPVESARSRPVRTDRVAFASSKGILNQYLVPYVPGGPQLWAGGPRWPAPVQFADGSGETAAWTRFHSVRQPDGQLHTENSVGVPILSSWLGCLGRDR